MSLLGEYQRTQNETAEKVDIHIQKIVQQT
jgi:hypothetical protein